MRLYKKAAAVLLAAAMAVFMMTACGGGAGGGPGVVEGVTYTSTADLVAGVDKDSITNKTPITMAESKYAAFMKMTSNPKFLLMRDKEVIEVQKILPFLSGT